MSEQEHISVKTSVDNTGFTSGLEELKENSAQFGEKLEEEFGGTLKTVSSAGLAAATALVGALDLVKEAIGEGIELAAQFANISEKFGVSSQVFQKVTEAAKQHDATLEDVSSAYAKLEINSQQALDGNKEQIAAFQNLGISLDDLKNKDINEIFLDIADGTKNAKDKGEAYADVIQILGKNAGSLFTTLKGGREEIEELGSAAGTITDQNITQLDNLKKANQVFFDSVTNWAANTFAELIAGFRSVVTIFQTEIRVLTSLGLTFGDVLYKAFTLKGVNFAQVKKEILDNMQEIIADSTQELDKINNPVQSGGEDADSRKARKEFESKKDKTDETAKAKQKELEEIARLDKEYAEKEARLKYDSLTLDEKIAFQKRQIAATNGTFKNALEQAHAKITNVTAREALISLEKEKAEAMDREKKKAEEVEKRKKEIAIEQQKQALESKMQMEQEELRKLQGGKKTKDIDDIRKIGGGLAGVNYAALNNSKKENQEALLKQQITIQKAQLESLKAIANPPTSDSGTYIDSE